MFGYKISNINYIFHKSFSVIKEECYFLACDNNF